MLLQHWKIIVAILILCNLHLLHAINCTEQFICYAEPRIDKSFAEQVIEAGNNYSNSSFMVIAYGGEYNSTNGSIMNFVNFSNVTIKKHPDSTVPVSITCPGFTTIVGTTPNGLGFEYSTDIEISGLNFSSCGIVTSGLYFQNTTNIIVRNSTFHHNTDNGIQLVFGNNISIINCNFYSNVGLQPDELSDLIINENENVLRLRGVGVGLFLQDQVDVNVTIKNCKFTNNIAYKTVDYNSSAETRPYGFIPFGNGGAIYLKLIKVKNSYISVVNCGFYNNTAIHQGGAIVMIPVNATNNVLNISECEFVGNKVLGDFLRSFPDTVNGSDYLILDNFINRVNFGFSINNFTENILNRFSFKSLRPSGGSGGAIAVTLFGSVEYIQLYISNSRFEENIAFTGGAIDFVVRDLLSNIESGVNSNQAFITNCTFDHNIALSGSAIAVESYARIDAGSLPIQINNCTFKNNDNLRTVLPSEFVDQLGISGSVLGIRFPMSFDGTNLFQSNLGGGININFARVDVCDHMKFYDNHGAKFGGAVRLGETTLMNVLPSTFLEFANNSASDVGGAFAVDNIRIGNDVTFVLNNLCFIQYNIGGEYEYEPLNWNVNFSFNSNSLTEQNGQGQDFFADDISRCVLSSDTDNQPFNSSIFSSPTFYFSPDKDSSKPHFETAAAILIVDESVVEASLGEIFGLAINAEDQNENSKDAVYSYSTSSASTVRSSNIIVIDLQPDSDSLPGFASVNKVTMQRSMQKAMLVMHDAEQLNENCIVSHKNLSLGLSLIDSTVGQVVSTALINVNLQCCHAAYKYDSITGSCEFMYSGNSIILREDRNNRKYIYIRSDRYGGFYSNEFVTATIPPSFQNCTQEGNLPGCIVMDDNPDDQCSQERIGFLCGRCKSNEGTALNLIECVSCKAWHIGLFIAICLVIVVVSFLIIYYNIGLPNALKGFLFFIQVVGYVYRTGVKDGKLHWDFYLSRFFGFSLYFPLCISSRLDAVDVALLGYITPMLITMCIVTYIILARFVPHLSARKTVDGIWFLVLIAYVYTADTCLNLLRCVQVHEPVDFKGKRVYYFDGELECYRGKHLPYGLTATIIFIFVLLMLPLYMFAISFNLVKKSGPLRDVISSGTVKRCHWWSGYDLLRRLLFFTIYLFCENFLNDYTQLSLSITALLILVITSRMHPYITKSSNFFEVLILLDLVLISVYFLDNDRLSSTNNNSFVIVLLVLPFLYFLLYLLIRILWKRCFNDSSDVATECLKLMPKRWGCFFLSRNEELSTSFMYALDEDTSLRYKEYRDELADFAIVAD